MTLLPTVLQIPPPPLFPFQAPTVVHANKAMFIIRVHYYVHVQLWFGVLRKGLSLKLPFLMRRGRAAEQALMAAAAAGSGGDAKGKSEAK